MLHKQFKKLITRVWVNDYQTLNLIELNRDNVLSNISFMLKQHPNFGIIPVLKANAYGHGLEEMATILNKADCEFLAVDGYFEASKIRKISKHRVLVLGYILPQNTKLLNTKKCSFVVQDIEGLKAFGKLHKPVSVHLELNTGMNRSGLSDDELPAYLKTMKEFPDLQLEGVMTHLADADNGFDDLFTSRQVQEFERMLKEIRKHDFDPKYIHIAQTAGSVKAKSKSANSIRLGIGLYGINPLDESDKHFQDLQALKPVLELRSTIIKIVDLKKGDKVSYNGIFTAPEDMKIGVLPLGYYEGIPRELSNKGVITYNDIELPIVGRVCMNHTMVGLKIPDIQVGDQVTVISNEPSRVNSVEKICRKHGLFNYIFVTNLSNSIRRVVV